MNNEEKGIELLKEVEGYLCTFKIGRQFFEDEPYQGFNDDDSFTICQGMSLDFNVNKNDFKIIYRDRKI